MNLKLLVLILILTGCKVTNKLDKLTNYWSSGDEVIFTIPKGTDIDLLVNLNLSRQRAIDTLWVDSIKIELKDGTIKTYYPR